jgi:putative glycosyltransferase (TIGR04372 family)
MKVFIKMIRTLLKLKFVIKILFILSINFPRIFIFLFFRKKKKNESQIKSLSKLGDIHTNHKDFTKIINFWEKINLMRDDLSEFHYGYIKSSKKNSLLDLNKVNTKEHSLLIQEFILNLKKNYNVYPQSTFVLFTNFFNISKYLNHRAYLSSNKIDNELSNFLFWNHCLRNLTHFNQINDKIAFIKTYLKKYNSLYCLKILQSAIDYNIGSRKLLKFIHAKIDSHPKEKNKFIEIENQGLLFYAFGHQLMFIEYFHRLKKLGIFNLRKKILMSSDYISNYCLTKYIMQKYSKNSSLNNSFFLKKLVQNKFSKKVTNAFLFGNNASMYDLSYKEYKKKGIISPSIDSNVLKKILRKNFSNKLEIKEKYICLFHRDSQFKNEDFNLNALNEDRTVDLENYKNVILYFCKIGYRVLLMGSSSQKMLNIENKNFFDYAHSKYKNDYNDIHLVHSCNFILNFGASGFTTFTSCFNKISLNLEFPFNRKPFFHDKCFYTLRPLYYKNKLMSKKDYSSDDLTQVHDFEILKKKGYILKFSKEEMLIRKSKKFIQMMKDKNFKKFRYFPKSAGKMRYFYNIID